MSGADHLVGASGTLPRRGDTTCLDYVNDIHGRGRGTRAFRTHGSASTIPTTLGELSNYDTEIQRQNDYPLQTPPTRISAAADAGYPVSPMHELSCDSNAAARSSSQTTERQSDTRMICATPFHPPPVPYPPYGYGSMPPPWHQVQPASPGFYPRDAFHYPPAAWPPSPYHHPGYHPPFVPQTTYYPASHHSYRPVPPHAVSSQMPQIYVPYGVPSMVVPSISTAHPENRPPQMPDLSSQHSLPQPAPLAADFATSQTVVITQPGDSIQPAAECAFQPAADASQMPEDDELELQENMPDIPAEATQYLPPPQGEIESTVENNKVQEAVVTRLELEIAPPACLSSEERKELRRAQCLEVEFIHPNSPLSVASTLAATASDENELEREWQYQMGLDELEFRRQCQEQQEQRNIAQQLHIACCLLGNQHGGSVCSRNSNSQLTSASVRQTIPAIQRLNREQRVRTCLRHAQESEL